MPLSLSLSFPDQALAAVNGADAVVLNPAALYLNQAVAVNTYWTNDRDFDEGDFALMTSGRGVSIGYQRLRIGVPNPVSRYDFAMANRLMKNLYSGLSYAYYRSDWGEIEKAHSWNASLLAHFGRQLAVAGQMRNINQHKFFGNKTSVAYLLSAAVRPLREKLTVGVDAQIFGDQRADEFTWRLSSRYYLKDGLAVYGGLANTGEFGGGIEIQLGRWLAGGEAFFDNDAKHRRTTGYFGVSTAMRDQLIQPRAILQADIGGDIPEEKSRPFLFGRAQPTFYETLAKLDRAVGDPKIRGLFLTIRNPQIGWARLADLRATIQKFRRAGKPVAAYLGPFSGIGSYYLASAADSIFMLPVDALNLIGLRAEVSFYAGAMEKIGVDAEVVKSGKYKNAPDVYTDSTMSPEFRESVEALLDDIYNGVIAEIAAERELTPDSLSAIINRGPFTTIQAESLKLIDNRYYPHEFEKRSLGLFGDYSRVIALREYQSAPKHRERFGEAEKIALIAVDGGIVRGQSGFSYLDGETAGSATVSGAIRRARLDSNVRAIVMRMNTPGGDAIAGDLIYGELLEAAKAKPVIVSMSDACASGGYYIAAAGSKIVLQPLTVTGSIGVFAGKPVLAGFYDKIGIKQEIITRGNHAAFYSHSQPFSTEERSVLRRQVSDMYGRFVSVVADGRTLDLDSVRAVAQGRVWSGSRALQFGLADTIGTVVDAIRMAADQGGISDDDYVVLEWPQREFLPRLSSLALSTLTKMFDGEESTAQSALGVLAPLNSSANLLMRIPYNLSIR